MTTYNKKSSGYVFRGSSHIMRRVEGAMMKRQPSDGLAGVPRTLKR